MKTLQRTRPLTWLSAAGLACIVCSAAAVAAGAKASGASMRLQAIGLRAHRAGLSRKVFARSSVGVDSGPGAESKMDGVLCCPVSFQPLEVTNEGNAKCQSTGLIYKVVQDTYLDLTPASGRTTLANPDQKKQPESSPFEPALSALETIRKLSQGRLKPDQIFKDGYNGDNFGVGVTTFENPLVSQVYERGWRQSFARAGFPGPDREFQIAQNWLMPVAENGILVDASCGSGLFTRRFVSSGKYNQIIALDYSDSMLQQTAALCKENSLWKGGPSSSTRSPMLVRADIARMPFATESIDAVHAGAAIHCWPSPSLALSEISRVLKPGGRAVLSTFMNPQLPFTDENFRKTVFGQINQNSVIRAWEEGELRDLSESVGLINFECQRIREFIIIKVEKPVLTS